MAVSIIKQPLGFILSPTTNSVEISNASGFASIYKLSHGLVDGDYVYVKSKVIDYNGFWYVDKNDNDNFWLREYATADRVLWIKNATGTIYQESIQQHGTQCVHLPIVYKLSNTLWPTNTADTVRTISTVTDSANYCALALSGDIKATGSAAELEFIKVTGSGSSGRLDGIYQIVNYTNDTTFVISLAYTSANDTDLTGASIQYYYNNYCIRVQIYGGLPSTHLYEVVKPIALISEVKMIPDDDGIVILSINDILKSDINNRNELLLGTLPNNIDFWTNFYISYAESYDDSDGSVLSTFTSSYTSDEANFLGMAINAKLPFKSINSGHMSEYIINNDESKFLTLFDKPVVFEDQYFDISFISDVYYYNTFSVPELSTFLNDASSGVAWTLGSVPSVTLLSTENSKRLYGALDATITGKFYGIRVEIGSTGSGQIDITINVLSAALAVLNTYTYIFIVTAGAINVHAEVINGNPLGAYVSISILNNSASTKTLTIPNFIIYPIDENFSIITSLLNNISTDLDVNSGLFRLELSDLNCSDTEQEIQLFRKRILHPGSPALWDDITAWDLKGFNFFQEDFTSAEDNTILAHSYNTIWSSGDVQNVDIVELDIVTEMTGSIVFVGPGNVLVSVFLSDSSGTTTSNTVLIPHVANGTINTKAIMVSFGDSTRINVLLFSGNMLSGSGTMTVTLPDYFYWTDETLTKEQQIESNCSCLIPGNDGVYLTWLNYLGGFDYWLFMAEQVYQVDIIDNNIADKNIFPTWPNSYGEFSDTMRKETYRESYESRTVRSQILTASQAEAIKYIRTSTLVQIINSKYDRRTVLIDTDSFVVRDEGEKQYTISFKITYTDQIPSQS